MEKKELLEVLGKKWFKSHQNELWKKGGITLAHLRHLRHLAIIINPFFPPLGPRAIVNKRKYVCSSRHKVIIDF